MRKEYNFSSGTHGDVIASPSKTRITIMLDDDILAHFRDTAQANGCGYQTMINATLRSALSVSQKTAPDEMPVTLTALRQLLREELKAQRGKQAA